MTAPIALHGVSVSFGALHALVHVDLEVRAGEVLALMGDNGAGKSTLIGVMSGAIAPAAGRVLIDGSAVALRSPADARRFGIAACPQSLALCGNLDVVENLYLGHEVTRGGFLDEVEMEHEARIRLESLGARIPDVRVPVDALSGGQQRSVAIARTLLSDPRVILLDEPTTGLGVRQTAQILTLIGRLRAQGHAVVIASHAITDVLAVADRIAVLRLGHLVDVFDAAETSSEELLGAITGATAPADSRLGRNPR